MKARHDVSVGTFQRWLVREAESRGYRFARSLPFVFNAKPTAWHDAIERMLAWLEQEDVDPRVFLKSVMDTCGWLCHEKGFGFQPGFLHGPGAKARYNKWLGRQRAKGGRADIVSKSQTREADAARVYVEKYASLALRGKHRSAHRLAMAAARKIDPSYDAPRDQRLIALDAHLHELHPGITRRIVLCPGWTFKGLFRVLRVLLAS